MNFTSNRLLLVATALLLSGCFSLKNKSTTTPATPTLPNVKQTINNQKQTLKSSAPTVALPDMLGGVLTSDSWTVYQDKAEEEFEGNVRYDNEQYIFQADYALSQRKKNLFTARGNVYVRHNDKNDIWYELYAHEVVYNYQTGIGIAKSAKKQPVRLVYHTDKGDLITATAKRAEIDTHKEIYQLIDHAVITRTDSKAMTITLKADKIFVYKQDQHALLQGHASIENEQYRFQAKNLEYDGLAQQAYAYGDRPLATGTTQDGTFAIIADKVTAKTDTHNVHLDGNIQGWVVSEKINQSKANETFNNTF